jgi:hypothetical protein
MATLLDDCHVTPAQARDLLRHASIRSLHDFYMAALTEAKRQAQAKLLSLLMDEKDS